MGGVIFLCYYYYHHHNGMNQIRIALNRILRDTSVSVDWMHLDEDTKEWRAAVSTVT